jgi:hypothetical protein
VYLKTLSKPGKKLRDKILLSSDNCWDILSVWFSNRHFCLRSINKTVSLPWFDTSTRGHVMVITLLPHDVAAAVVAVAAVADHGRYPFC